MPEYTRPEQPPEGYYRLNYGRMPAHTFGKTTNNPLLFQLAPENTLWVNPLVANEKGLTNGEYVRLANPDGIVSNRDPRACHRTHPPRLGVHGARLRPPLRAVCG